MGKGALARYHEFQRRLARCTEELSAEMFPEGLPEGLTFSDLEAAASARPPTLGSSAASTSRPSKRP